MRTVAGAGSLELLAVGTELGAAAVSMKHTCHWPGCKRVVAPALWGCGRHWFTLPKVLRDRIWATYRAGQEVTKTPSSEYVAAAQAVQAWIREHGDTVNARERG